MSGGSRMPMPTLHKWLGIDLVEVSVIEKAVSALGGDLSILTLVVLSTWAIPGEGAAALIASMGASAIPSWTSARRI